MSQSRFSIVLVGVSALLRRPLVSRLRSAAFTARGDLPFRRLPLGGLAFGLTTSAFRHAPLRSCRSAGWPSGSRLPLFGTHRFGVALGGLVLLPPASEIAARRVGLRASVSAFRHAPLRGCRSASWPSGSRLPLSACTASGLPSASWFFCLPFRRLPLGELVLLPSVSAFATRRVGASAFRFGDCRSAGWPSGSRLPLFGTHRFGITLGELALLLGGLVLLPSASEIAAGRVGLRAHGFRFSACADPHRRTADARADGAHRHDTCFTSIAVR